MSAVGINFIKKKQNRELYDFFTTVEEEDNYKEETEVDINYIN